MQQVRKASAVIGALATVVILGLILLGTPGTAAQRGGGTPPPPTTFETLCVSVHNQLTRAIANGTCQSHEVTVEVGEDLPLTLCVNEFTKVARAVEDPEDCAAQEDVAEVTGLEDFSICVSKFTAVVRVPAPAGCQASEINGILRGIIGADRYESLPNVGLDVPVDGGLLANDVFPIEIESSDSTSQQGGDVALNPDGSFTYAPPAGFTGEDMFNYIARDGGSGVELSVEITVEGPVIWFVDNGAAAGGDGRLSAPFDQIAAVNDDGGDPDGPGDSIFLFASADFYTGGLVLEENQKLIGQCLDLVDTANIVVSPFSAELPEPPAPGSSCVPFLENTSGNGVDLAPGTLVGGLFIRDIGQHGIAGADFTGDVEIVEVAVSEVGANAVNLVNIDGTVRFVVTTVVGHVGDAAEDGGDGINAENVNLVDVSGGGINAGNGGDSTTAGVRAGEGGTGIYLVGSNAEVTAAFVNGGIGGSQSPEGSAGNGGDGIYASEGSAVTLTGGVTNGGDGGSAEDGSGGDGGNGMFVDDGSSATIIEATLIAGDDAPSTTSFGGDGGRGVFARDANTVSVSGSLLIGRPGAPSTGGSGGTGGDGLGAVETASVTVTASTLTGGAGVDSVESIGGAGGSGLFARSTPVSVSGSTLTGDVGGSGGSIDGSGGRGLTVVIQSAFDPLFIEARNNVLEGAAGEPGLNVVAFDGEVCLNAVDDNDGAGGPPIGGIKVTGSSQELTLSITQASLEDLSADNNDAIVDANNQIGFGCAGG